MKQRVGAPKGTILEHFSPILWQPCPQIDFLGVNLPSIPRLSQENQQENQQSPSPGQRQAEESPSPGEGENEEPSPSPGEGDNEEPSPSPGEGEDEGAAQPCAGRRGAGSGSPSSTSMSTSVPKRLLLKGSLALGAFMEGAVTPLVAVMKNSWE